MLQPRYYQKEVTEKFFDYTASNWGKHPLVVMPTGSGKSLVIAYIIKRMLEYKNTRVMMITHQQELIKQNLSELYENLDNEVFLDVGIYCAGLHRKDTRNRIIFCSIQSVYKKAWELGWFDVILVDEAHLINNENTGIYRSFFNEMEKINKNVVIGGLSATPYRMKSGLLTEGDALFDDICYEVSIKELINPTHYRNIDKQQYLCDLISKNGVHKVDLSDVHIRGGEYVPKEMEHAFMEKDLVVQAIREIVECTHDRKKILIFTAGIMHCEEVFQKMQSLGLNATCVHSKQSNEKNQINIKSWKAGNIKYLLNIGILATGFNEKAIDCIVLLCSTMSPGRYSQWAGRGFRLHPDKKNCLILDFGRNIETHGPVDKIEIKKNKNGKKEVNTCPQKECPACHELLFLAVQICPFCGHEFPQKDKHEQEASNADILSKWKKPEKVEIQNILYSRHQKVGKPDSLRVDYYQDIYQSYTTWVCLDHEQYAKKKALQWIRKMTDLDIKTVDDALDKCDSFKKPSHIMVDKNGKYPEIISYIFNE
jgi:DNA repair protein RadD